MKIDEEDVDATPAGEFTGEPCQELNFVPAYQPVCRKGWLVPADGTAVAKKVVAVVKENSFGAFEGPSDWDDSRVADFGQALKAHIARSLFPSLEGLRYMA